MVIDLKNWSPVSFSLENYTATSILDEDLFQKLNETTKLSSTYS